MFTIRNCSVFSGFNLWDSNEEIARFLVRFYTHLVCKLPFLLIAKQEVRICHLGHELELGLGYTVRFGVWWVFLIEGKFMFWV